jgi:hypothetical protein
MSFILGTILGLIVGAGLIYLWLQKTIDRQQQELKQSRRSIEELSNTHEARLRDATQRLQTDYKWQLSQQTEALQQEYEAQLQAAKQTTASSSTPVAIPNLVDTTPTPSPTTNIQDIPVAEPPVSYPTESATPVSSVPVTPVMPSPSIWVVVEDIEQKISTWAIPGAVTYIPHVIRFANHPDPQIRLAVASTLETITTTKRVSQEVQQAIPTLGKLSRDVEPMIRHAALVALANIPSEQVLPFLEQALRDPDGRVVKVASEAIAKYKFYAIPLSGKAAKSRRHARR